MTYRVEELTPDGWEVVAIVDDRQWALSYARSLLGVARVSDRAGHVILRFGDAIEGLTVPREKK